MTRPKFNIAIDVSPLSDDNSLRGVGYYTKNLVAALQQETKTNPDYRHFHIGLITRNCQLITDFHLVHYPYFDPFKLTLPVTSTPFVVTVHDLIPREFKSHFPVGLRGEIRWLTQKHRLKQAQAIITPSLSAKYSIADILRYPADQIFVTPEAADPSFHPIKDPKKLLSVKRKYHLPDQFVLFVGDLNWNKNIPTLVKVCLELQYPLVIVGSAATRQVIDHPWNRDILWLQQQSSPLLHLTGFVPDADLPAIFNLATIYCQPSFAEGFGLPLLQAMQSGTPTVFANASSLPEISNLSGPFFDPHSPADLKQKLSLLWSDPSKRAECSRQGLAESARFAWSDTALQTLAVYGLFKPDE